MALIPTRPLKVMIADAVTLVEGLTSSTLSTATGAVVRALLTAAMVNDSFIQSQIKRLGLNSRLDTADDDAVDTYVNQFSPPFVKRLQATFCTSFPVAPTALASPIPAGGAYVRVLSVTGLANNQNLRFVKGLKFATATIQAIQPTTTLTEVPKTAPAATSSQGATTLKVASVAGMFVGGMLNLRDGAYSTNVTINSIDVGLLTLTITPIDSSITTVLYSLSTVVTRINVLQLTSFLLGTGTAIEDLSTASVVIGLSSVAVALEGLMFFRKVSDTSTPAVPAGYKVQAKDGSVVYEVVADAANPNYDVGSNTFKMPANETELFVRIRAVEAGTANRVQADQLTIMPIPINGIDGCTNKQPIQNGSDRETTPALIKRFRDFISALSGSNEAAMRSVVAGVEAGIQYKIRQNTTNGVDTLRGHFLVIVSDASGVLGTELYEKVYAAVDAKRPLTVTFGLAAPTIVNPAIEMILAVSTDLGYDAPIVKSNVKSAIFNSFAGSDATATLVFWNLVRLALSIPGAYDVLKLTVNGNGINKVNGAYVNVGTGPANITATDLQLIRPALANINIL